VYVGDTVQVLPLLEPGWVDAVVTDPPYGLEFAGQAWDGSAGFRESLPDLDGKGLSAGEAFQAWCAAWARGALQVLKPGGHAAVFGGTRMWHRLVAGVEQAGFEIRDQIAWLYSSGMPKSLDISYAIDQRLGEQRLDRRVVVSDSESVLGQTRQVVEKGDPVTDEAREWSGWGTGLKPGFEPIMIARKPLDGTVAANVLAYGTGGLNIDAARVDGRWPANVALDEGQAVALDAATGSLGSDDSVSARFPVFRYESKASASERPRVCGVSHVTVKPLSLMRWLVRLLTPVGGVVLEPFAGSGTTVEAAVLEGYRVVAIEKDPDFVPLIQARLERLGL
jgi:site-specific DNA-methyltransferase (adenine-specific)